MTTETAFQKYRDALDQWDRVLLRGSRRGLADAAEELQAMGESGAPWAEKLLRRVAELDADEERRQRLLDWCDLSPSRRLLVVGEHRGVVGWVSVEALSEERAKKISEDGRRLMMIAVAREATRIEGALTGASASVEREGISGQLLEHGPAFDWRFDPDRVSSPPPAEVIEWWEVNRGNLSVRCSLHGEIARFDVSDGIGMLCPAWDVAVVEYHNRWERRWDDTYDTPDYDGCKVSIEPTVNPASANLLDVEEMWIVTEGGSRPWWPYEVIPRHQAEED
jgi:hypothetical protein